MTKVDWVAVAVIALAALNGLRRGLVGGALALAGIAAGAYFGAKLAPQLLSGDESAYTPLIALGGAVLLAGIASSIAAMAGSAIRTSLFAVPPLRVLDSLGGLVLGAAAGAAIVWVAGAVALHLPGQRELRTEVQRSRILGELNARVPPARLLDAIARVDPFLTIPGPEPRVEPPDPGLLATRAVQRARPSVLRITGTACGLVHPRDDARVDRRDGRFRDAVVVAFDPRDDIAILRVDGLDAPPLQAVDPVAGRAVAILGYPENGTFTARPGRIGQTSVVVTEDAYGRGPVQRQITTLRGNVRRGNSGGPAVDAEGRVQTTIFAARVGVEGQGYGVPTQLVREELGAASGREVSTGPCVR